MGKEAKGHKIKVLRSLEETERQHASHINAHLSWLLSTA